MVTNEEVKNAMEYKWRRNQAKLLLILWAAILLIYLVVLVLSNARSGWDRLSLEITGTAMAVVTLLYSSVMAPFCMYYVYKRQEMVRNCGRYEKHRVKLDMPETSWFYRQSVAYRVHIKTADGKVVERTTKPLFSSSAFADFPLSDYNNKTVEVFYDPENDTVILSGNAQ